MLSAKENRNPGETKSRIETCQRQPRQIALNRMTRVTAMMAGQYIGLLNRISRAQKNMVAAATIEIVANAKSGARVQ